MTTELEELRKRSKALFDRLGDSESLEVNAAILDLVPADPVATKRFAIGLLKHGQPVEALDVLEAGLRVHPEDSIMLSRKIEAEKAIARLAKAGGRRRHSRQSATASGARWTDFEPAELVEGALAGLGRDACVRLCAASILAAQRLDQTRTAVTPIKQGRRFRVIGGKLTGVAPWRDCLSVAVPVASRSLIRAVEAVGGRTDEPAVAVPCVELIIPRARVAELFEDLLAAHMQHLRLSIEAGPPGHLNKDHPGLRRYLLDQADLLESR